MVEKSSHRRSFLTTLGVAALIPIAGCSSSDTTDDAGGTSPTETPTPTPTPSPNPTPTPSPTPNQQALDHYEQAIELLVENKAQLDTWATEGFDGDSQTLESLTDAIETARTQLDQAEQHTDQGSELIVRINQARLVTVFQELNIVYYQGVQTFWQLVSDARTLGNNQQHGRAAEKWGQAKQFLSDIRGVLDDMAAAHKDIDNDALNEPELDYSGDLLDYIDLEDRRAVDAAEDYTTAYKQANLAFVQLEKGNAHYENEAYTKARSDWETGRSQLKAALSAFERVVDNDQSPQDFHDDSLIQIGTVETLIEAFDKFVAGAKAAADGNPQKGNKLVGEGYEILDQA